MHERCFTVNNSEWYSYQWQDKKCNSKSFKTFIRWSFSDNFTVETDDKAKSLYENTRSVANISSEYTSSVG